MLATVEHEENTGERRKEEQPVLRKYIVMQLSSSCLVAYHVLLRLVVSIQRGQVNVRRCVVLRPVSVIGPEASMDDKRGEAETDGSEGSKERMGMKSIAHPNMREEFPAGCGTKCSRWSKASKMRCGSGSSPAGMAIEP